MKFVSVLFTLMILSFGCNPDGGGNCMTSDQCEQGECVAGDCVCDEAWTGAFCNTPRKPEQMTVFYFTILAPGTCEAYDDQPVESYSYRLYDGSTLIDEVIAEDFNGEISCGLFDGLWDISFWPGHTELEPLTKYTLEFAIVQNGQETLIESWNFKPWEFDTPVWERGKEVYYEYDSEIAFAGKYSYIY